jgi:hypothetical protein
MANKIRAGAWQGCRKVCGSLAGGRFLLWGSDATDHGTLLTDFILGFSLHQSHL